MNADFSDAWANARLSIKKRLMFFLDQLVEHFVLPLTTWKISRQIVASILIASFLVNILALIFPLTLLQVYDRIIPNKSTTTLFWLAFCVFSAIILGAVLQISRSYIGAWADARFEYFTGCKAYKNLMSCRINEYEKFGSGCHFKRISALNLLKNFYAGQLLISLIDIPFIFIFLFLIFYISGWLVLVPIFSIFFLFYLIFKNSLMIKDILNLKREHDDKRLNFIVEIISNIHTVKSNSMEAQIMRRYEHLQGKTSFLDYEINQCNAFLASNSMTFSQLTIVLVACFGGVMVFNGYLTVGALAASTLLSGRCLQPVNLLLNIWARMQAVKVARRELDKVLNMNVESGAHLNSFKNIKGKIDIENLSFKYDKNSSFLFNNFSLHVKPDEVVGITGQSFSGKSTLMYFLMGIIRPSKGRILIDDKDIFTFNLESVRSHIGYMSGNPILFKGTILENLTMFESRFEEDAIEIIKKTGLIDVIEHLPDGLDTKIGYQSSEILSRGIMQRLTMARALVRKPKILLFDEANISLDRNTDDKVKEFLKEIIGSCTIIIVSHRDVILNLADTRYKMENGKLSLIQ